MTLIEFVICGFTVAGFIAGGIVGAKHGISWGIGGCLLGGLAGYALSAIFWLTVRGLVTWFGLPDCRVDAVHKGHILRRTARTREGTVWVCGCGLRYFETCWRLLRRARFLEILPDGSLRPYMQRSPFGRWKPDCEEPPAIRVPMGGHP